MPVASRPAADTQVLQVFLEPSEKVAKRLLQIPMQEEAEL